MLKWNTVACHLQQIIPITYVRFYFYSKTTVTTLPRHLDIKCKTIPLPLTNSTSIGAKRLGAKRRGGELTRGRTSINPQYTRHSWVLINGVNSVHNVPWQKKFKFYISVIRNGTSSRLCRYSASSILATKYLFVRTAITLAHGYLLSLST